MEESKLGRIPHEIGIKLRQHYDAMKSAERRAVDYILEHPEEVRGSTIIRLAECVGCSEATISRLARKLGFDGYPEFRMAFSSRRDEEKQFDFEGILSTDDTTTVLRKVFYATRAALTDTLELADSGTYDRAIAALLGARKIVFCGLGDAAAVANEACKRFLRIGENSHTSEDPDTQLLLAAHLAKDDVLVAISHSGRSSTVLEAMRLARKADATVILITNFPVSPLAKHADILLLTAAFSKNITGEVISRRVAELCIIESLYISCFIRKGYSALEKLNASNDAVFVYKI